MDDQPTPINEKINSLAGQAPLQRLGFLVIIAGVLWAIFLGSDMYHPAGEVARAFECLLERCGESSREGFRWAIRTIALGLALRFLAIPVWRWLRAGSR